MEKRKQKNIIIGSLLAVLVVMTIGYAAFTTSLTINGTSSINSNWCVGFDSTKTNTYTATAGITGGTVPTGSMTYSGSTCQTSYKTNASLSATFLQPGDKIVYTLTIANKGSLDASIDSITVDNVAKTSTFTTTKGNIKFTVTMPANNSLAASTGTTTMTVTAEFQNTSNLSSYTTSESRSINVGISASQNSGGSSSSNQVYAINTNTITQGTSTLTNIGTTYSSCQATGKNVCLRYTLENDVVTGSEVCFVYNSAEYCLTGADNGAAYTTNQNTLTTAFGSGNCTDGSCRSGSWFASSSLSGIVEVHDGSWDCNVVNNGGSHCYRVEAGTGK